MAMERLDAGGIEVACYGSIYVPHRPAGFFHSTGAQQACNGPRPFVAFARLWSYQVKMDEKDLADAKKKLVTITLRPVIFPTVRIRYTREAA